jgi:hypothetical protein
MGDDEFEEEYDFGAYLRDQLADLDALIEGLRSGGVARLAWYRAAVEFRREFRRNWGLDDVK